MHVELDSLYFTSAQVTWDILCEPVRSTHIKTDYKQTNARSCTKIYRIFFFPSNVQNAYWEWLWSFQPSLPFQQTGWKNQKGGNVCTCTQIILIIPYSTLAIQFLSLGEKKKSLFQTNSKVAETKIIIVQFERFQFGFQEARLATHNELRKDKRSRGHFAALQAMTMGIAPQKASVTVLVSYSCTLSTVP